MKDALSCLEQPILINLIGSPFCRYFFINESEKYYCYDNSLNLQYILDINCSSYGGQHIGKAVLSRGGDYLIIDLIGIILIIEIQSGKIIDKITALNNKELSELCYLLSDNGYITAITSETKWTQYCGNYMIKTIENCESEEIKKQLVTKKIKDYMDLPSELIIYDLNTKKTFKTIPMKNNPSLLFAHLSLCKKYLIVIFGYLSITHSIKVWDLNDNKLVSSMDRIGFYFDFQISPSNELFAYLDEYTINFVETKTLSLLDSIVETRDSPDKMFLYPFCFLSDNDLLYTSDNLIKLYNLQTKKCYNIFRGHHCRMNSIIALNADHFVSAGFEGKVFVWHKDHQEPICSIIEA